jgi:transposase
MYVHGIRNLWDFEGFVIEKIRVSEDLAQVTLRRDQRYRLECPDCGQTMGHNRTETDSVRDLPLGSARGVRIVYPAIQGYCSSCQKHATILPPGIRPHARATWRLMVFTARMCHYMSTKKVAELLPVSQSTAYRWDKKVLEEMLPEPDLDDLRLLLVDEKSIWKKHGYVTVVINGETGELLHLAKGKKKKAFSSFFDKLTDQQADSIEAVCMDRGGAFKAAATEHVPDAQIVYDKFHIIKNYLDDVVDQVRRSESRDSVGKMKELIKGQRYNLFRNPENLSDDQEVHLEDLLAVNERLSCVYVLKDALRELWNYTYRAWARKYLEKWIGWARERKDEIPQLSNFADSLKRSKAHILNYFNYDITLGPLEGFNNLISRLIHRSCGHTDLRYLFLKLRQESLGFFCESE